MRREPTRGRIVRRSFPIWKRTSLNPEFTRWAWYGDWYRMAPASEVERLTTDNGRLLARLVECENLVRLAATGPESRATADRARALLDELNPSQVGSSGHTEREAAGPDFPAVSVVEEG